MIIFELKILYTLVPISPLAAEKETVKNSGTDVANPAIFPLAFGLNFNATEIFLKTGTSIYLDIVTIPKENIINLEESNTFEYVYPLWYMLDKLANNNTNKLVQQEFKDYMAFFPDINDLITGIITKDLNLGLSIKSINKIMNNLDLIDENENSDNKVVNLCNYK